MLKNFRHSSAIGQWFCKSFRKIFKIHSRTFFPSTAANLKSRPPYIPATTRMRERMTQRTKGEVLCRAGAPVHAPPCTLCTF